MLALLNHVLGTAPQWTDVGHKAGLVGVPINALLDWPMGTKGGFAVFQDPTVNAHVSQFVIKADVTVQKDTQCMGRIPLLACLSLGSRF